ncbi:uncharacterized protein LOC141908234 [Tubulanus polymorphus]|uniref:uncharacterized protein LOC141908234 n=1 Tax=Tubulanus polymorphus TaxID=672921 RepID=UPI003DA27DC7
MPYDLKTRLQRYSEIEYAFAHNKQFEKILQLQKDEIDRKKKVTANHWFERQRYFFMKQYVQKDIKFPSSNRGDLFRHELRPKKTRADKLCRQSSFADKYSLQDFETAGSKDVDEREPVQQGYESEPAQQGYRRHRSAIERRPDRPKSCLLAKRSKSLANISSQPEVPNPDDVFVDEEITDGDLKRSVSCESIAELTQIRAAPVDCERGRSMTISNVPKKRLLPQIGTRHRAVTMSTLDVPARLPSIPYSTRATSSGLLTLQLIDSMPSEKTNQMLKKFHLRKNSAHEGFKDKLFRENVEKLARSPVFDKRFTGLKHSLLSESPEDDVAEPQEII